MDKIKVAKELIKLAKGLLGGKTGKKIIIKQALSLIKKEKLEVVEASHGLPFDTRKALKYINDKLKESKNNVSAMLILENDEVVINLPDREFFTFGK